mgnify:CR=1 FL=1
MPNFFKSFFSGKSETPESEKQKNDQKNFEIFKYDGLRAQRMGRPDYAVKCFIEALAIKEEFETMGRRGYSQPVSGYFCFLRRYIPNCFQCRADRVAT